MPSVLAVAFACCLLPSLPAQGEPERPLRIVDQPGQVIEESCRIRIPSGLVLPSKNGAPALIVRGENLVVSFETGTHLRGALEGTAPERIAGIGLQVEGDGIQLEGLHVSGYKIGLKAEGADLLQLRNSRFEDGFRQRLGSTPEREDASDWLRPHDNDAGEWAERYGAAVLIRGGNAPVLSGVRVRSTQNGILLERVEKASVSACDASFLSGWGLAMWRCRGAAVRGNAFCFCIRGYSHGVYNRGQDSAGILLFEQCTDNIFTHNAVTHGGDGVFAFAGKEALAGSERRGCNSNLFSANDLSFAAAHGLELTFSAEGSIVGNLFEGNAICGLWGGYSQELEILKNRFLRNGDGGYGLERGGIAIEHGFEHRIARNLFEENRCAIRLWEDDDEALKKEPWVRANWKGARGNRIGSNHFRGETPGARRVELERTTDTTLLNNAGLDLHEKATAGTRVRGEPDPTSPEGPGFADLLELGMPRGYRHLGGREAIIMTEYGPWDHQSPLVRPISGRAGVARYEVHGLGALRLEDVHGDVRARILPGSPTILEVSASREGLLPYRIRFSADGEEEPRTAEGNLMNTRWVIRHFPYEAHREDPRENESAFFRRAFGTEAFVRLSERLDLPFAMGGPRQLTGREDVFENRDRFGTLAHTKLMLEPGRYRVRTLSDDGVRVSVDGRRVIDEWNWHGPTEHTGRFEIATRRLVHLEVAHFELDGYSVLRCELEPLPR